MAVCRYCGRYHDPTEWPTEFRAAYVPHVCFPCYEDNPERADSRHSIADEEDEEETE